MGLVPALTPSPTLAEKLNPKVITLEVDDDENDGEAKVLPPATRGPA